MGATACGAPAFPKQLFTVGAKDADYPVMLSKPGTPAQGRQVQTDSGISYSESSSSYTIGNVRVKVTRTNSAASELPADVKLAAQVKRQDAWVQMEEANFVATDFSTASSSSWGRHLVLTATVVKGRK